MKVEQLSTGEWLGGGKKFAARIDAIAHAVRRRQAAMDKAKKSITPDPITISIPYKLVERGKKLGIDVNAPGKRPTFMGGKN